MMPLPEHELRRKAMSEIWEKEPDARHFEMYFNITNRVDPLFVMCYVVGNRHGNYVLRKNQLERIE